MPSSQFEFFGLAHVVAMGVVLAVPIVLTLVVKRLDSFCNVFAGVIALNEVLNWSYRIANEFVQEYMPLHVCGITVFAVVASWFSGGNGLRDCLFLGACRRDECGCDAPARYRLSSVSLFSVFYRAWRYCGCCAVRYVGPRHATDRQIGFARFCFAQCSGYCFDRRQFDAWEQLYVPLPSARYKIAFFLFAVAVVSPVPRWCGAGVILRAFYSGKFICNVFAGVIRAQ